MLKKIIYISLLIIAISTQLMSFALAADKQLENQYPAIPGAVAPTVINQDALPGYIKYILYLSIAISGILAFGVLIVAGLKYLTSTGDSKQMGQAMDQITSAFIGLLILLSAWIILNTINPQLTTIEIPQIQ